MARAKKKKVDGIMFDSIGESQLYEHLLERQMNGEISKLECQPQFTLLDSFKVRDRTVRGSKYTSDFRYIEDGQVIVEEFKGYGGRPDYLWRRKIFLYVHGQDVIFRETKKKGKGFVTREW